MATSSTWWAWQKAASAAMPSELLGNEVRAPWRPMRASREDEAISTPQMMRVTVTCLVCATEMSCDCSVVRDLGSGPWAERRSKDHRMNGSRPPAGESIARLPHRNSFLHPLSLFLEIQG